MSNLPGLHSRLGERWCMGVPSNSDRAPVQMELCDGSAGQQWTFTNGVVQIYGNMCLNVDVSSAADVTSGTYLNIVSCIPGDGRQQFIYTSFVQANVVKWTLGGFCVIVKDEALFYGNHLYTWTCSSPNPVGHEIWDLIEPKPPAPPPSPPPQSTPPKQGSDSSSNTFQSEQTTTFSTKTLSTSTALSFYTTTTLPATPTSSGLSSNPSLSTSTAPDTLNAASKFPLEATTGAIAGVVVIFAIFLGLFCLRRKRRARASLVTPFPADVGPISNQLSLPLDQADQKSTRTGTRFYQRQSAAGASAMSDSSNISLLMRPLTHERAHPVQEEDSGTVSHVSLEDASPPAYKAVWNRRSATTEVTQDSET